jgi:hypothetical protein
LKDYPILTGILSGQRRTEHPVASGIYDSLRLVTITPIIKIFAPVQAHRTSSLMVILEKPVT